jgi:hypothetical protein
MGAANQVPTSVIEELTWAPIELGRDMATLVQERPYNPLVSDRKRGLFASVLKDREPDPAPPID